MATTRAVLRVLSLITAAGIAAACAPADSTGDAASAEFPKPAFNEAGELERAEGYREWVYVGTPLTPNSLNPPEAAFPEFHNVYIHPDDFAHWQETGEFPDGTVIVKELILVGDTVAVSGNGYFMGEFTGFETTVKDSARFPDEPANWAYFTYGHTYPLAETAPALPTGACNACHEANAADDWVFTQYYPVLTASKGEGAASSQEFPKPAFNEAGELERAEGYREWVYVGTPLTPNSLNPPEAAFPEFHNVYIHPDDFAHWKETGEFPDGTVIVKELVLVGDTVAVSGKGYFMGEFTGFETTIKDSARFPDEPGNWAYFTYGHTYPLAETAAALPAGACNACHDANAADDWVFTQYYPILTASKGGSSGMATGGAAATVSDDGGETDMGGDAVAVTGDDVVPVELDALFAYLQAGSYKGFATEAAAHTSVGPHPSPDLQQSSMVRAFFNSAMDASLKAGNATHPQGSAIVKEFYDDAGEVSGWAVSVKTSADSENGQGWYWYETLSTTDNSNPVAAGNGVALCWGCHATGKDFVLSSYP